MKFPRSELAPYSIGQKLRTLRIEKGLTLSRLGREAHLSTALLSKLETESMVPTLQTLVKISHIYGVDLAYFFTGPTQHSLAITRHAHVADERRSQHLPVELPLHHSSTASRQVSRILEIPAGVSWSIGNPGARTELTGYVIAGVLHLTSAGSEEVLNPGDCLVLDTDATSLWTASPETSCRVLAVFARK
jgi:transcriptional regulator with XRE-family HTH domain